MEAEIAKLARVYLGRPAKRGGRFLDMDAVDAVVKAATELGVPRVWGWALPGLSVKGLAKAYMSRVVQSFGIIFETP